MINTPARPIARPSQYSAILFDCDGVLVDSEPLTMRVLRDMLAQRGWDMPLRECMHIFVGKATRDEAALIEAKSGQPFTQEWLHQFWAARDVALRAELQPIAGAAHIVQQAHAATNGRIACVSGADRAKIALQLGKTGLLPWFEGRIYSGHETPRNKPHPDVYLAAMQGLQVPPAQCLVLEDTLTGIRAAAAAGATTIAYRTPNNPLLTPEQLLQAGAVAVIGDVRELAQHW